MKIIKTETEGFDDYEVTSRIARTLLGMTLPWKKSIELKGVLEADDKTGRVVSQVLTSEGDPIYTNGTDDIIHDNTMKMLMLIPAFVPALLHAGFHPKTVTTYESDLRIINKNPRPVVMPAEEPAVRNANG